MDRCLLCGQDDPVHAADCPDAPFAQTRSVFVDPDEIARARAVLDGSPGRVVADESFFDDAAFDAWTSLDDGAALGDRAVFDEGAVIDEGVVHAGGEPFDEGSVGATDSEEPWAIPIREPAVVSDRVARAPMDQEQRRLLALVGGGLALLVLAVVGALVIGGDDGVASDAEVAGSVVQSAGGADDSDAAAPPTPSVTVEVGAQATTSTAAPDTTTSAPSTTSTTASTTTTVAVSDDTGDVPVLSPSQIGRGWVAQVSSVPQRSGGEALQRAHAVVEADAPTAVAIRSDDWPALRSGFWVIVIPGYDTGADALAGCSAAGQGGDCLGRFLSSNAEQNARVCTRAEGGGASGDCGA